MKRALVIALLALSACAAASGYDPKRYRDDAAAPTDPDTVALPKAATSAIPDPKRPPAPEKK